MKKTDPRLVEIDWLALQRAFERFDPTWEAEPLPYLNLRTGKVSYFGADGDIDIADTLDFERHVALTLPERVLTERHARMRAFVLTLPETAAELSQALREALSQEGGVTTFYEILHDAPAHCERWQRLEGPRVQELMDAWMEAENLQATNPPPWRA